VLEHFVVVVVVVVEVVAERATIPDAPNWPVPAEPRDVSITEH